MFEMPGHPLKKYYQILDGEATARYLSTKKRRTSADLGADQTVLWSIHDKAMRDDDERGNVSLLDLKAELGRNIMAECHLCERGCRANRANGFRGHCGVLEPRISSEFIHMGEEPDLIPSYTIFFAGCTFECVFCQNWDISTKPESGIFISPSEMAIMIAARAVGGKSSRKARAVNVNWVGGDPTSNLPFILETLRHCTVNIPQVWNSNMYLTEESMRLLDGVIDVYLTDFKYGNDKCAIRLSNAPNYMRIITRNHLLARSQAEMIIRHLVLPGHVECCSRPALTWISENLRNVKVNVMAQYRPEHKAREYCEIARPLQISEFEKAMNIALELGLDVY